MEVLIFGIIGGIVGLNFKVIFDWLKGRNNNSNTNGNGKNSSNGMSELKSSASIIMQKLEDVKNYEITLKEKFVSLDSNYKNIDENLKYFRDLLIEQKEHYIRTNNLLENILSVLKNK